MSDQIEPGQRAAVKALRTAMKAFSGQALALNRIFSRTVKDAVPGNLRFHEDKADLSAVARRAKADGAQGAGAVPRHAENPDGVGRGTERGRKIAKFAQTNY